MDFSPFRIEKIDQFHYVWHLRKWHPYFYPRYAIRIWKAIRYYIWRPFREVKSKDGSTVLQPIWWSPAYWLYLRKRQQWRDSLKKGHAIQSQAAIVDRIPTVPLYQLGDILRDSKYGTVGKVMGMRWRYYCWGYGLETASLERLFWIDEHDLVED